MLLAAANFEAIGSIIGISVDMVGLILAVVAIFVSPRLRKPAIVVAIALLLALCLRGGSMLFYKWGSDAVRDGQFTHEEYRHRLYIVNLLQGVLWSGVHVLLILAAFCWRGTASLALPGAGAAWGDPAGAPSSFGAAGGAPLPPLSAAARVGSILACAIPGTLLVGVAVIVGQQRKQEPVAFAMLALGGLLALAGGVMVFVTLHALWSTIQPPPRGRGIAGLARASSGAAVGLLLIPFFNFYWAFHAIPGLATDLNRTLDQRGLHGPRASRGLGIAWCVLAMLGWIPFVGLVTILAGMVIVPMFLSGAIAAANAIRRAEAPPAA